MICHRAAEWIIKTRKDSLMLHAGVPVMNAEQGTSYITTAAPLFRFYIHILRFSGDDGFWNTYT
jgi:hypothetical protein